jgi:hypothetical protein
VMALWHKTHDGGTTRVQRFVHLLDTFCSRLCAKLWLSLLSFSEHNRGGPKMIECLTFEPAEALMIATALHLTVTRSHRQAAFPLPVDEIILGRCDASRGVFPDLDLSPDGGYEGGVSRRHARIFQRYGRLFIEDAGSTNGTLLNDCRLVPHPPYRLQAGDTLQLGRLRLLIGFD